MSKNIIALEKRVKRLEQGRGYGSNHFVLTISGWDLGGKGPNKHLVDMDEEGVGHIHFLMGDDAS